MEILKKLVVVLLTVIASTVLVRLILQWVYQHGQPIFSVENIVFGLTFPVVLVFFQRNLSILKLILSSAGFAIAMTVFDFVVVHYDLGWPGATW